MYHLLSKILVWGIYPFTLGMSLLVIGYWFERRRDRRLFRRFSITGFFILYLFSITPVQRAVVRPLGMAQPTIVEADAIVVLGGNPARSLTGIRLFKQGVAPVIITAGGSGELLEEAQRESDRMSDFLLEFGVPPEKIITESESRNTRQNAVNTKTIMDSLKVQTIALVTSSLHMRRSVAVFKKLGYDVLPVTSRLFRIPKKRERFDPFMLFPNVENLSVSNQAIYEYFALTFYKVLGWV